MSTSAQPFPPTKRSKPSACIFIGLNILRVLSIVAMCLVFASQIWGSARDAKAYKNASNGQQNSTVIINGEEYEIECDYIEFSSVPDQAWGIFWAILSRVFILIVLTVLLPTELHTPTKTLQNFYTQNLPPISALHGLGVLGVLQCWIGSVILSKFCPKFEQVSGWVLFLIGILNCLAGLAFRQSAKTRRRIFSWENAAQLTPQTKAAHAAYTHAHSAYGQYAEKLAPLAPFANAAGECLAQKLNNYNQSKLAGASNGHNPAISRQASSSGFSATSRDELLKDGEKAAYEEPKLGKKEELRDEAQTQTQGPGWKFGGFKFAALKDKGNGEVGLQISGPIAMLPKYKSTENFRRPNADA